MYLLDTNIVSMLDPRRHAHAPELIAWLKRNGASLFLSVLTIAEMDNGVLKLRREGKTDRADDIAGLVTAILTDFADRVLGVDLKTARQVARLGEATAGRSTRCRSDPLELVARKGVGQLHRHRAPHILAQSLVSVASASARGPGSGKV